MSKILFSTLIIFFSRQILAQNNAEKPYSKFSKASAHSAIALKLNVFAPILGYSQFSLEKPVSKQGNIEFGLGIIGAGKNLNIQPHIKSLTFNRFGGNQYRSGHKNQFGGFFELGYKFRNPFNITTQSQYRFKAVNTFEGFYIKPSFILGAYSFNQFRDDSTTATIKRHHSFGTLLVNFGDQWAISSRIILEIYIGGGPEIDNVKEGDDLYGHPFVLAVAKDNPSVNFATTAGFRFGFLLK